MIKDKEKFNELFFKYSVVTLLMFISAVNYNLFLKEAKIVSGGAGGIATIVNNVVGFDNALVILVVMVFALLLALLFKKKELFRTALYASILSPLFVSLTDNVTNIIGVDYNNKLLIVIYSGLITGIINGILCKFNMSGGGVILICQLLCEKIKYSVSKCNFFANIIIVLVGGYFLGITSVLYTAIYLYISSYIMNKVLLGVSKNKIFYIVSSKDKQIKDYVLNVMNLDYTLLNAEGALFKGKNVIMVTLLTKDYFKLKEGIKAIDKKAFFVVTDSYQVLGGI